MHERSKKNVGISQRNSSKIDPRASWAALAETNGLQVLLRGSPGVFLTALGAPRIVFQALLAALGPSKSALGAARARFRRPKHRAKSCPGAILVTLTVQERFGNDFRKIFDRFSINFGRFSGVNSLVRHVALWTLWVNCHLPEQAAIVADPRRHKFILNEEPRFSPSALSHTALLLLQTTTT